MASMHRLECKILGCMIVPKVTIVASMDEWRRYSKWLAVMQIESGRSDFYCEIHAAEFFMGVGLIVPIGLTTKEEDNG